MFIEFTLHKPPLENRPRPCRAGVVIIISQPAFSGISFAFFVTSFSSKNTFQTPLAISTSLTTVPLTMLPRSITASAVRVGSTSHPMLARGIATAAPLLRQQERRKWPHLYFHLLITLSKSADKQMGSVPRGHVRPTRRPIRHTPLPDTDERPGLSYQSTTTTSATDGPQAFHAYEPYDPLAIPPVHHSGRVDIPPDPSGVLGDSHAAREILGHESLVIVRQLEMLNVFMGVCRPFFFFFFRSQYHSVLTNPLLCSLNKQTDTLYTRRMASSWDCKFDNQRLWESC